MSGSRFIPFAELSPAERLPRADDRFALNRVDGAAVPGGTLRILLGPRIVGKRYFRLQVQRGDGPRRFIEALYNDGPYPGHNWVEIFDLDLPEELRDVEHFAPGLRPYLQPVADAIPAGGHMMAEYEKLDWHTTQRGLLAGIPPIATPLGALLFELGVGDSFKDWYFPEGGMEGSRKLQGNKAYDAAQRAAMHLARAEELRRFLGGPAHGPEDIDRRAREDAERVLAGLSPAGSPRS